MSADTVREGTVEAALRDGEFLAESFEQASGKAMRMHGDPTTAEDAYMVAGSFLTLLSRWNVLVAALRSRGSSDTRRRCLECGRDEDYAMEDGSWICEACGCVDGGSSDTRLTEALRENRADLLEACEAAEAWAGHKRWLGFPSDMRGADRIDQVVARLRALAAARVDAPQEGAR